MDEAKEKKGGEVEVSVKGGPGFLQSLMDTMMRDKTRVGKRVQRIGTLGSGSRAKKEAEIALAYED